MGDSISKWHEMEESKEYKKPTSLERDVINKFEEDFVVTKVINKFADRSKVGIQKYNTTLYDNKGGLFEFLTHLEEELMDATLYIEKVKSILNGE